MPPTPLRWRLTVAIVIFTTFLMMAWLSLAKDQGYNHRAYDLGSISQAIWSVSQGEPLIHTGRGIPLSRLAEHAELFYFLLAPFYALRPEPSTLLLIQAAFYALGAIPLFALAYRKLQYGGAAATLTAVYLFYPVAQTAVLFEFHADTIAMPLFCFVINALDQQQESRYFFWLTLALSCKFYVALPVTALGLYLWWRGDKRLGTITFLLGLLWGVFAFFVIRTLFAPPQLAQQAKATASGYLTFYFGQLTTITATDAARRLATGLFIYAPVILLGRRALGWIFIASTIILPALISTGPGPAYDYRFHHYALAVPFLVASIIYGAHKRQQIESITPSSPAMNWKQAITLTLFMTLLFNSLLIDSPLNLTFYAPTAYAGQGLDPTSYQTIPRDHFKDSWLAQNVPPQRPLMADHLAAMRLTNRTTLYLTRPLYKTTAALLPEVDAVVVDALFDFVISDGQQVLEGGIQREHAIIRHLLQEPTFQLTAAQDGLLRFSHVDQTQRPTAVLTQTVTYQSPNNPRLLTQFGDSIGLVAAELETLTNGRYALHTHWLALQPEMPNWFAISQLEGVPHSRIVHLPTTLLHPTTTWPTNQIIKETITFTLPPNLSPGTYPIQLSWHDKDHPAAAATNNDSKVDHEYIVATIVVTP